MKIVLVNTLYPPDVVGGAELSVQLLAEGLVASGRYEVTVVALGRGSSITRDSMNGVEVIRVPLANLYWPFTGGVRPAWRRHLWHLLDVCNPVMGWRLYWLIREIRPQILHTNNLSGFSAVAWLVSRFCSVFLVHTTRDYYLMARNSTLFSNGVQQDPRKLSTQLFSLPKKWLSRLVNTPVGISRAITDLHRQQGYFPRCHPRVVYNAVADNHSVCTEARHAGSVVLGFMGRLEESKGIDRLLAAFSDLPHELDITLLVAGDTNVWFEKFLAALGPMQRVSILGWSESVEFLSGIDALVVPSLWQEPFGRVVIEAYSFGKPVVVSNRGGLPELVNESTGLIFDPDKEGGLQAALLAIVSQIRAGNYDSSVIKAHAEQFSVKNNVKAYDIIYTELVAVE